MFVVKTDLVLRIEEGAIRPILDERNLRCHDRAPLAGLPVPPGVQGLTLEGDGKTLFVSENLGLLRLAADGLTPVVAEQMFVDYSNEVGTIVSSYPVDLVATKRGIFVASTFLGVFAFLEKDGEYEFSQLVVR